MMIIWRMVPEIWSATDRIFSFWTIFSPFTLLKTQKIKILKNWKNTLKYHHFTHVCHKWQSYDVCFLRFRARQRKFFDILGHFLPFYPNINPKNEILKKWKKNLGMSIFYINVPKIMAICYTVSEIWRVTDVILIFHFGLFLPFYPPNSPKIQNFNKMKNTCEPKIMIRWCTVPEIWCVTDGWRDGKNDM